jgi:signal peptidase II
VIARVCACGATPRLERRVNNRSYSFYVTVLVVIALDQIAKLLVVATVPLYESATIIPHLLDITYVRNSGLAYGLMNDWDFAYKPVIIGAAAVMAFVGIHVYARQMPAEEKWSRIGLSLILAGAIGNILDRVRLGYVIDYVDFYWGGWHFWAFNVADASISVGAVFVFADILLGKRHASRSV